MMCTTVLHGGICHRTSTPHKSGNKMKEKKHRFFSYQCSEHLEVLALIWVRFKVLGSDYNNRFPNTNHNLNHNSNDNLTLSSVRICSVKRRPAQY